MGIRKIFEVSENQFSAKVFLDYIDKEYIVKFYRNGKIVEFANYYTDDEADAIGTAKAEVQHMNENWGKS